MSKFGFQHFFGLVRWPLFALYLLAGHAGSQPIERVKVFPLGPVQNTPSMEKMSTASQEGWKLEFNEDFSNTVIGEEPVSLFILDGAYTVQNDKNGERVLALPGTPTRDFGILFGRKIKEKALELRFSFFSTSQGRRMPSVAASVGGVRGLRFRLNPAARNFTLSLDEVFLKEIPFTWRGNQWWSVRFQALPSGGVQTKVKLWPSVDPEPVSWLIDEFFKVEYKGGKCALWGFPYAGTSILFDDIAIFSK